MDLAVLTVELHRGSRMRTETGGHFDEAPLTPEQLKWKLVSGASGTVSKAFWASTPLPRAPLDGVALAH
jgi:hypothetical protein